MRRALALLLLVAPARAECYLVEVAAQRQVDRGFFPNEVVGAKAVALGKFLDDLGRVLLPTESYLVIETPAGYVVTTVTHYSCDGVSTLLTPPQWKAFLKSFEGTRA